MSFKDLARNGGRELSNYQNQATREVEALVFKLASNVSQLRKLVDMLGTPKDTLDHRHRIADVNGTIQDLAKNIKDKLTALHDGTSPPHGTVAAAAAPSAAGRVGPPAGPGPASPASLAGGPGAGPGTGAGTDPQLALKAKRLLQDFANILQDYKATQRMAAEREAASLPRPAPGGAGRAAAARGPAAGGDAALTAPLLGPDGGVGGSSRTAADDDVEAAVRRQAQRQAEVASLEDSVRYSEALIAERDAGIAEIQRQIGEVNEMFQDLAVLIADQGEQLQTVDTAISSVAQRVEEGQRQLLAASRSSRAVRNKCLMLWLIAAVVVSVLLIILLA